VRKEQAWQPLVSSPDPLFTEGLGTRLGSLLLCKVRHLTLEENFLLQVYSISQKKNTPKLHYATSTLLTNVHQICSNTIIAKESHFTKRNLLLQGKYKIWEKQTLEPVTWNKHILGHLKSSFCIHDLVAATLLYLCYRPRSSDRHLASTDS